MKFPQRLTQTAPLPCFSKNMLKSMSEIAPYISFGKSKTTKLLKDMEQKGVIAIEGKGKGTKYRIK